METITPRQASQDLPARPADAGTAPPTEATRNERGTTCGMGRSGGFMTLAVIAAAMVVVAGFSFGWTGWLTASLGGISLLFLLPCLVMCVGMVWMMMRGGNDQTSKAPDRHGRP